MPHVIVKVSDTHHGTLKPGMMIVLNTNRVKIEVDGHVQFPNPSGGGWSFGQVVDPATLELQT